jgi:hypothetical protein
MTPAMAKSDETSEKKYKEYSEKPTEGIESPFPDYGSGYFILEHSSKDGVSLNSDVIVISGDTYITQTSHNEISGYAKTVVSEVVDTVGYIMKFQIWDGYDWITYAEATKERNNYISVHGFHYKEAESGYYYRLKVIFYYRHNGVFDSLTGYSHYIKVS